MLALDYGFRIYNSAIGKFLSVDPLTRSYPMLTPYQFASNTPIAGIDLDGLELLLKVMPKVEYKPVFSNEASDLSLIERIGNSVHNVAAIVGNGLIANTNNSLVGAGDFTVDLIQGKYNDISISDIDGRLSERLEAEADFISQLTFGQYVEDGLNAFTEPENYEAIVPLLLTGKLDLKSRTTASSSGIVIIANLGKKELLRLRNKAVRQAWKDEVALVFETGRGTRNWTRQELGELKANGRVKGYAGHHINDVLNYPKLAGNPNNIEFLQTGNLKNGGAKKGSEHYLKHNTPDGQKIETTAGSVIDRTNSN